MNGAIAVALDWPAHRILRDVEELSNEEVAEALGASVSPVRSRLHGARMALLEQLTRHPGLRP